MFELNSIRTALVATVALHHPVTGEPIGATVDLAGPEHPQRKAIQMAAERRARADKARGQHSHDDDPDERKAEAARTLAGYTLGWSGITEDGQPLAFSPEAALRLYSNPALAWLVDQIVEAFTNRANFIESSGKA
jgi:hypothetical protein